MSRTCRRGLSLALCLGFALASPLGGQTSPASDPRSLVARAEVSRMSEDWYRAIEDYLAALAKNPNYAQALSGLADCYYALDEYEEAMAYIKKAAPLLRGDTSLLNLEGFVRIGLADLAGASAQFKAVLGAKPNDLDARFGLALLDLAGGKKTEAKDRLEESLRISPQNSRALLSLALIAQDQGKREDAQALIERALRYHGQDLRVQLTASHLAAQAGDLDKALFHARNALSISSLSSEARGLLGALLVEKGDNAEAIAVMREGIGRSRKDPRAWYTLGMAQEAAGRGTDALYSFKQALALAPDDEVLRLATEYLVQESLPVESQARSPFADWHFDKGVLLESRSLFDQASAEYRRGLTLYPDSKRGRILYAELLKKRGRPARQLAELRFLDSTGHGDTTVRDAIETYESLLADSVSRSWRIDQFEEPKRHYAVAFFLLPSPEESAHPGSPALMLRYLEDQLSASSRIRVMNGLERVETPSEAFRLARERGADYYVILTCVERERDLQIQADLRVGRTGSPAATYIAYRSGNDRLRDATVRLAGQLDGSFQSKGQILRRVQNRVLVDLGAQDGLKVGDKLLVLKKGELSVRPEGLGPSYQADSVLGEITLTVLDEEVAEGQFKAGGFFDTMNAGDEVLLAPTSSSGDGPKTTSPKDQLPPAGGSLGKLFASLKRLR